MSSKRPVRLRLHLWPACRRLSHRLVHAEKSREARSALRQVDGCAAAVYLCSAGVTRLKPSNNVDWVELCRVELLRDVGSMIRGLRIN